jgi:hypothetical protein
LIIPDGFGMKMTADPFGSYKFWTVVAARLLGRQSLEAVVQNLTCFSE